MLWSRNVSNGKRHQPWDIDRWRLTSVVACAHCSFIVERGLCGSIRQILSWSERLVQVTLVMAWPHQLGDICCSMRASIMRHRSTVGYNSQGLHVSILACVHQLDETFVACMHWPGEVGQLKAASTKVFTHMTWFMHIWKETLENDMQHHPRINMHNLWSVCIIFATLTSTIKGTISQVLCASGKGRHPMVGNIS